MIRSKPAVLALAAVAVLALAAPLAAQPWSGVAAFGLEVKAGRRDPLAGAQVLLRYAEIDPIAGPPVLTTGADGRVEIQGLASGRWRVDVSKDGFSSYLLVVDVEPSGEARIVSGPVRDATGERMRIEVFEVRPAALPPPVRRPEPAPRRPPEARPAPAPPPTPAPAPPRRPAEPPVPTPAPAPAPSAPPAEAPPTEAPAVPPAETEAEPEVPAAMPEDEADPVPDPADIPPPPPFPGETEPVEPEPAAPQEPAAPVAPSEAPGPEPEPEEMPAPAAPEPSVPEPEPPAPAVPPAEAPPAEVPEPEPPAVEPDEPTTVPVAPAEEPGPEPEPEEVPPPAARPSEPTFTEPLPSGRPRRPAPDPQTAPEPEVPAPPAVEAPPEPPAAQPVRPPAPAPPRPAPPAAQPPAAAPSSAEPPPLPWVSARVRSSAEGDCPECETGQQALVVEQLVGSAGSAPAAECAPDLAQRIDRIAALLGEAGAGAEPSALISREGGALPALQGTPAGAESAALVTPFLRRDSSCQALVAVLPPGATFTGYTYEAADAFDSGPCTAGEECAIGSARWLGEPVTVHSSGPTLVYGVFQNASQGRERRATMTVYFTP